MNTYRDEDIMRLVQEGQTQQFDVLIERYEQKLRRYVGKFLSNPEDIADVVQQTFMKAYVYSKNFRLEKKFSSWIYRIAHNEMVNAIKRTRRRTFLPLLDLDVVLPHFRVFSSEDPRDHVEQKEMQTMVNAELNQLPEKYREPLALYYLEDFSYQEIADIMHIPIATVGVRINRGKGLLKNRITR